MRPPLDSGFRECDQFGTYNGQSLFCSNREPNTCRCLVIAAKEVPAARCDATCACKITTHATAVSDIQLRPRGHGHNLDLQGEMPEQHILIKDLSIIYLV
jgi:hypothetical protein